MRPILISATVLVALIGGAVSPIPAAAKGCIKGAVVGGIAGHYAGHHGVLGAGAGCVVGHHMASKHAQQPAQTNGSGEHQGYGSSGSPESGGYPR